MRVRSHTSKNSRSMTVSQEKAVRGSQTRHPRRSCPRAGVRPNPIYLGRLTHKGRVHNGGGRRSRQSDESNLGEEGTEALALLRLAGGAAGRESQGWVYRPHPGSGDRKPFVDALGKIEPRLGSGGRFVVDDQLEKSPTSTDALDERNIHPAGTRPRRHRLRRAPRAGAGPPPQSWAVGR